MNWKGGLAAVFTPTSEKNGDFGTAFPVADGVLMTARHVVRPKDRFSDLPIIVRWWWSADGWKDAVVDESLIVWECDVHDIALLKHPRPKDVEAVCILESNPIRPRPHLKWEGAGYPAASRIDGEIEPADFQGDGMSMAEKQRYFTLQPTSHPQTLDGWGGASGMPVVVDGAVIGVVTHAPDRYGERRLNATPLWKVWDEPEFRKHIPEQIDLEELKNVLQRRLLDLGDDQRLRAKLAAELNIAQALSQTPNWAEQFAGAIANMRAGEMFSAIARAAEEIEPQTKHVPELYEFARAVAPIVARLRIPSLDTTLKARDGAGFGIVDVPASSLTLAEMVVASGCGRRAEHSERQKEEDEPPGFHWVPLQAAIGKDVNGGRIVTAVLSDLANRYCLNLDCGEPCKGGFGDTVSDVLHAAFDLESPDIDTVRRRLRSAHQSKRGCPYLAIKLPSDENETEYVLGEINRLSEIIPEMPIVVLSGGIKYDEDVMGGFRYLIPRRDTQ